MRKSTQLLLVAVAVWFLFLRNRQPSSASALNAGANPFAGVTT